MKILAGLFLSLFIAVPGFFQTKAPTTDDIQLLKDYRTAKNNLFKCYTQFGDDKSPTTIKTLDDCRELRLGELAVIYGKLSTPSAIKLLLGAEMSERYSDHSARAKGGGNTKTETNLDSLVELQRITVLQNQRIIELLEKLLNKK